MTGNFFVLGFLLSLTPGPVLFHALQMGLARDRGLSKFLVGTYLGVIIIASVTLTGVNIFSALPYSRTIFIIINASVLAYIGFSSMKTKHSHFKTKQRKKHSHPYLNGFLMSATSPSRWAVWISTASLIASAADTTPQILLHGITFALGSVALFLLLAYFSERLSSHIRKGNFVYVSRFAGVALICFAAISLMQLL